MSGIFDEEKIDFLYIVKLVKAPPPQEFKNGYSHRKVVL
jgi:hypothetical protein